MNITHQNIVGEVVAGDYRAAAVFEKFGLDFCCKGNNTIEAACEKAGIDPETLIKEIEQVVNIDNTPAADYNSWPLDLLADYIEKKHHRYVTTQIPVIQNYLEKISAVHGSKHPELISIKNIFSDCAQELTSHMKKEELILFPFIRKMVNPKPSDSCSLSAPFGSIKNPVAMMMHEHDIEGDRFRKIASLSNNYTAPQDSCNTYQVAFALLKEFEDDLHLHIHLENNILFPKALALEL